jgi:hypothetical protein
VVGFIWRSLGKFIPQDFINEMFSKQDKLLMVLPRLIKRSLENNVISRRGDKNTHTLR